MFRESQTIGPYTLVHRLGRGGFGEVWLAEKRTKFVTTRVAVKLPLDDQIDHEAIKHEATLWEQASGHPNILPIIDADEYNGQVVIVSEYAPDGSLEQWLKTHGKMTIEKAVETTIQILDGLEFLHSRKIIHRDLKPANILLQGKTICLADFGISRALRTTMASKSQHISGTFAYMSPEALDGKRSEQTDIWAVGVNLYQFLTGMLPFPQTEPSALFPAIIMKEYVPLADFVPPKLKEIVAKSLAKSPEDRYKKCGEMREDLRRFLQANTQPISEPVSPPIIPTTSLPETVKTAPTSQNSEITNVKIPATIAAPLTTIRAVSPPAKQKNGWIYFLIIPAVLLLLIAIGGGGYWLSRNFTANLSPEEALKQGIAATVNGKAIKLEEVDKTLKAQGQGNETKLSQLELNKARLEILQNLIQEEVLYQKAESEKTVPTDNEVNQEFRKKMTESGLSAEAIEKQMKEAGETEASFKAGIKKQLAISRLLDKITGKVEIPKNSEIEDFYKTNAEAFVKKPGVQLSAIVIDSSKTSEDDKITNETEAAEVGNTIIQRLKDGEDFAALARERSEDETSRAKGGDLGFINEDDLKENFSSQVAADLMNPKLQIGQIYPVQAQGKYFILKVRGRADKSEKLTLESPGVKQQVIDGIINSRKDLLSQSYTTKSMNEAKIVNYLVEKKI